MYWPSVKVYIIYQNGDWYKFKNLYYETCVYYTGSGSSNYYKETTCDDNDVDQDFVMPDFGSPPTKIIPRRAQSMWIKAYRDSILDNTNSVLYRWRFLVP